MAAPNGKHTTRACTENARSIITQSVDVFITYMSRAYFIVRATRNKITKRRSRRFGIVILFSSPRIDKRLTIAAVRVAAVENRAACTRPPERLPVQGWRTFTRSSVEIAQTRFYKTVCVAPRQPSYPKKIELSVLYFSVDFVAVF